MSELWAELKSSDNYFPPMDTNPQLELRDQFAMAALPSFIGKTAFDDDAKHAAVMAYKYADAMMQERQWQPEPEDE
jgi:hypothetical protein